MKASRWSCAFNSVSWILCWKKKREEKNPFTNLGIFDEKESSKIEKVHADLKIKYEKAKIEINENIDQKLFQEPLQIVGAERSNHATKMAKRAKTYKILYDRFLKSKILE